MDFICPQKRLALANIGLLISNAKASAFACPSSKADLQRRTEDGPLLVDRLWRDRQMSNECQRPKSKNVIGVTLKT